MDKKLEQMVEDLERILNLFKKMENSSIEDVDTLKKESILIQEELKERYDKSDTGETDPQET
jgi:Asp-tRNA(Asn)/Glu-tRNA(Gln) amidotransferase C subunit|tara:strand:- start:735 stop:920 length:186 start_codon:yes stop_codon:yes gene_type:complete